MEEAALSTPVLVAASMLRMFFTKTTALTDSKTFAHQPRSSSSTTKVNLVPHFEVSVEHSTFQLEPPGHAQHEYTAHA